jgi:hypothetical protein
MSSSSAPRASVRISWMLSKMSLFVMVSGIS